MYKKGTGNDKQRKDAGNRTLFPYRNFSQAINIFMHQSSALHELEDNDGFANLKLPLVIQNARDMAQISGSLRPRLHGCVFI